MCMLSWLLMDRDSTIYAITNQLASQVCALLMLLQIVAIANLWILHHPVKCSMYQTWSFVCMVFTMTDHIETTLGESGEKSCDVFVQR